MTTTVSKAVRACEEVVWAAKLNAVWIGASLLGGIVLGLGPATVTAFVLGRRHHRGEEFPLLPEAWRVYRREFGRGNRIGLPVLAVGLLLAWGWQTVAGMPALGGLVGFAVAGYVAVVAVLLPMYAHYELPLRGYLPAASKFVLLNLPGTVLVLLVTAAIGFASYLLPGLLIFFSFGLWITADSYLCQRFFQANDDRVAARPGADAAPHHP